MKKVKLGELITVDSGYAFKSNLFNSNMDGIPVIRIRDVSSGEISTYYSGEYDEKYVVNNDDLLIGMDGAFNIRKWSRGRALLNQRVCRVKSKNINILLDDYLYRVLPIELKRIEDKTSFVTVKHLSVKDINEIEINLPDIKKQQEIINVLDKAQELMDKRKEQIETLDELVKSKFIEMFGEKRKYKYIKIEDLVRNKSDIVDGPFGSNLKTVDYVDHGVRVIQINNIGESSFRDKNKKYITEEKYNALLKHSVVPGDIVVAKMGEPIGRACILPDYISKAVIVADCMKIRPNLEIINKKYLEFLLNTEEVKIQFRKYSQGSTRVRLNLTMLRQIEVLYPPIELQNEFADFVKQVDKLKSEMEKSLKELEDNFNSLMQRAFIGELF